MSATPLANRLELSAPLANTALRGTARLWFVVAALGQWIFTVYVARVYGTSAARGDFKAWNETLFRLRTEKRSGPRGRLAMATALVAVTVAMSIGIYLAATKNWLPRL